jgi:hypothetical protein
MANRAELDVTIIPGAGAQIARSQHMRAWLAERMKSIADDLRSEAPVKTGRGRGSIHSDVDLSSAGWTGTAGWDTEHYYMGIQQTRTHWADQAVSRIRYV